MAGLILLGGGQPDYAQGDETAVDFVKNKPCHHYRLETLLEQANYKVVKTGTTVSNNYGSTYRKLCSTSNVAMPEGVCVRVSVAGVQCLFTDIPSPSADGRSYRESVTLDNGITLSVSLSKYARNTSQADRNNYYYQVIAYTTDDTLIDQEYAIEMLEMTEEIKKLDAKFLPNVSDLDPTWLAELKTALGIS